MLRHIYYLFCLAQLAKSTVFLNRAEEGLSICGGSVTPAIISCTTTTSNGFLLWRNSSGLVFSFDDTAIIGANGTLGSTRMTLTNIKTVSNAMVYTSTASENMIQNTTIQCSDGEAPQSIDITLKSPSSPSWAYSPCRFTQGSVRLSWNPPSVAPECCEYYTVQLSTGSVNVTTETSVTVPIRDEAITVTVYCVDGSGNMVTKSQDITINANTDIEQITIEPLNNSSCDDNITYQVSLITNTSGQDDCTPPIINSTVTCNTSSTHLHVPKSMICSVPANETVSATVTITNAGGFTASKSATADALAQCCQRFNSSSTPSRCFDDFSSAKIAAIVMGILVFLLAVICIVLTVYIVWNRTSLPLKEKYQVNSIGLSIINTQPKERRSISIS